VAQVGSITRAAALLDYAQSSVTAHIRTLEDDLGVALFDRTSKGVAPTDAGVRLLDYAETILRLTDEAREDVRREGQWISPAMRAAVRLLRDMVGEASAVAVDTG